MFGYSIADMIALQEDMQSGHKGRFDYMQILKAHKKNKKRRWNNTGRRKK